MVMTAARSGETKEHRKRTGQGHIIPRRSLAENEARTGQANQARDEGGASKKARQTQERQSAQPDRAKVRGDNSGSVGSSSRGSDST